MFTNHIVLYHLQCKRKSTTIVHGKNELIIDFAKQYFFEIFLNLLFNRINLIYDYCRGGDSNPGASGRQHRDNNDTISLGYVHSGYVTPTPTLDRGQHLFIETDAFLSPL